MTSDCDTQTDTQAGPPNKLLKRQLSSSSSSANPLFTSSTSGEYTTPSLSSSNEDHLEPIPTVARKRGYIVLTNVTTQIMEAETV